MEQRRPRLGDIIDDYCPRERRLSNHVIVAIIGDDVKQTRCTTCDADHPYKGARVPARRKKKEAPAALYQQVLEGVSDPAPLANGDGNGPPPGAVLKPAAPRGHHKNGHAADPDPAPEPVVEVAPGEAEPAPSPDDEGPVHRPLIRATLPRHEGQTPERKAPDFTLRLPGARLGPFRNGDFQGQHPNRAPREGNRAPGKPPHRPSGHKPHRHAQGGAPRNGQGGGGRPGASGQRPFNPRGGGRPHHGGGKKRSR
jgi:hypothetical protein